MYDFPNSPTVGQIANTASGSFRWDGTKWAPVVGSVPGSGPLPAGGTTGQALIKNSATNYDTTWGGPYLPLTGGTLTGNVNITTTSPCPIFTMQKPSGGAGIANAIIGNTGAAARWALYLGDGAAESGSNTGSNFTIARCNDAGSGIDQPFTINRASGQVNMTGALVTGSVINVGGNGIIYSTFGGNVIALNWTGSALQAIVNGAGIGNITITSDYRTKKDITALGGMWAAVKRLRPVSYTHATFKIVRADDKERWGFLAHEMQDSLIPDAATGVKDGDEIQSPNPWTIIAALTKALQEAMARIETLEAKVT